jgi:hypothetical protein
MHLPWPSSTCIWKIIILQDICTNHERIHQKALSDVDLHKGINKSPSIQSIQTKYQLRSGPAPLQSPPREGDGKIGWSGVDRPLGSPVPHLALFMFSFHVALASGLPMAMACGLVTKIAANRPPLAPPPECMEACKETQLHSIYTIDPMMVWSKGHGEEAHGSLMWHVEASIPPLHL